MWKPALNRVAASTAAANLAAKTFHTYADLLPEDDETICVRAVAGDNRLPLASV